MKLYYSLLYIIITVFFLAACKASVLFDSTESKPKDEIVTLDPNCELVAEESESTMVFDEVITQTPVTEDDHVENDNSGLFFSVRRDTSELLTTEDRKDPDEVGYTIEIIAQESLNDDEFVRIIDYIPDVIIDLKYSSTDNFTGSVIYNFSDAYLRYGTVKKLQKVQEELRSFSYGLKIWDAFRPVSAQYKLWEIFPNTTYVANPNTGYSSHSRGNTVDVTLVFSDGTEVQMPTEFDDFTQKANRDYSDCDSISTKNVILLENIMNKYGFNAYFGEWWHFSDSVSYGVETTFEPPVS